MNGSRLLVRVLGPVTVEGPDGVVPLPGTLPRGFLAVLALEAPRPVAIDRLTTLLWGDQPPAGVKAALQQLATRARRALSAAGAPDALRSVAPGYALIVDPMTIDVRAFRAAVRAGVDQHGAGDAIAAAATLADGLSLWRDVALADLVDLPMCGMLGPTLDDERWRAEELRAEALIAAERPGEAAALLSSATSAAPLRERLWVLQARALAAAGQTSDAVRCARSGIAVVSAMLGVPPGPELAAVEQSLRDDAVGTKSSTTAVHAPVVARAGLLEAAMRRALEKSEHAAVAATARVAHDESARHWQRALDLLDSVEPDDDEHRLRLLLGLGWAKNTVGLDSEAREVFLRATEIARRSVDGRGFAWAVLGFCSDRIGFAQPPEQAAMLVEALAGIDDDQHLLRGRLLARLATERYWTEGAEITFELATRALAEATLADDVDGRLWARYALAFGCWTPSRAEQLVEVCEVYLDEARSAGDHTHQLLAHRWLVPAVTELGDVARGEREALAAIELADELGHAVQQWMTRVIAASQQLIVGDLERAESLASEALMVGMGCEPDTAFDYVSMLTWTLAWLRGTLGDIVALVESVASAPGVDAARRLGLALTYGELGRLDEAATILDSLSDDELRALPQDASWYISLAALAEASAACQHRRTAELAFELLRPYHERLAVTSVTSTGPVAHHLGIAAWTAGRHEQALRILADAVAIGDRVGAPVFAERSRRALAERRATLERLGAL